MESVAITVLGATIAGAATSWLPAQAIPWNVVSGTQTSNGKLVSGHFSIDSELAATPVMLASNVTVDGYVFAAADAMISNTAGLGITAVDWVDTSNNVLSFVFSTPLTPQGGTALLDTVVSTFTPFSTGTPLSVSGSVHGETGVPGPLALSGVATAFAASRQLRRRVGKSRRQSQEFTSVR